MRTATYLTRMIFLAAVAFSAVSFAEEQRRCPDVAMSKHSDIDDALASYADAGHAGNKAATVHEYTQPPTPAPAPASREAQVKKSAAKVGVVLTDVVQAAR